MRNTELAVCNYLEKSVAIREKRQVRPEDTLVPPALSARKAKQTQDRHGRN